MNALRADLDQPDAAVHQTSSPGRGVEPALGLELLAGEVALTVKHSLRLAGGAGRERDQARVLRRQLGGSGRAAGGQLVERAPERRSGPAGAGERGGVALVADDERRAARRCSRSRRSLARSCSVQGSTT